MLYFSVVMLSLNISSWWWMWMSFELSNWLLILIINSNFIISFLLIQSFSSLLILFSVILMKKFIILLFLIKMGLPPFHYWVLNNQVFWSLSSFVVFITIHKWVPTAILMSFMMYSWISLVFMLLSFILFWTNHFLKIFIFSISINDMGWMILSWFSSMKLFLFYLLVNLITFFMMSKMNYDEDLQLLLLFMMNLPPFLSFLIKWTLLSFMPTFMSVTSLIISWVMIILVWYILCFNLMTMKMIFSNTSKLMLMMIFTLILWVI